MRYYSALKILDGLGEKLSFEGSGHMDSGRMPCDRINHALSLRRYYPSSIAAIVFQSRPEIETFYTMRSPRGALARFFVQDYTHSNRGDGMCIEVVCAMELRPRREGRVQARTT